jgi:cyclophilin family peptidyl-prolyl cis-trans isomerase
MTFQILCLASYLHFTEPFEDEIHPRLRFTHRGLVACANNGEKNSNDSQFFITLGKCWRLMLRRMS